MVRKTNAVNAVSIESLAKYGFNRIAVAIGVFDGVHKGHQKLLNNLLEMSARLNTKPVVLTFYPHPRQVLFPNDPLKLLVSREKKFELLANAGIDAVVTLPFTNDFASMSPENFLDKCLDSPEITIAGICVGAKWRFGADGKGDSATLSNHSKSHEVEYLPVEELKIEGRTISSTAIRRAINGGLLEEAEFMLGRRYSVRGKVKYGANIATAKLNCPTANISTPDAILPPDGVYAAFAITEDGVRHPAAVSVGVSPSFADKHRENYLIETHLLDYKGDLYGKTLETEFVQHIREERCYRTPEELAAQIADDLAKIAKITAQG
jgi:riboflavin kinase/FMN adenylyltransferase